MNQRCKYVFFAALTWSAATPAELTTETFLDLARRNPDGHASAYLLGIVETERVMTAWFLGTKDQNKDAPPLICFPESLSAQGLQKLVVDYMQKNPARWNESAYFLARESWLAVWRCKP